MLAIDHSLREACLSYTLLVESRKYFVDQVASTILENHGETGDSFIFGISGKWGEGKTYFLKDLEQEIKSKDGAYVVLWINPWKFASDKISFLRSFLAQLPKPKLGRFKSLRALLRDPAEFRDLHFDVSRDVIDWRILLILGLYIFWGLILYSFGNQLPFWDNLHAQLPAPVLTFLKIAFVSLLIPIGLAAFKSISTFQQGSKTISTIDKFEDLLKLRIQQNIGKKFLVYIDDLDRVTPTVARDVLDNLRTFFDKPELSFVVAGDHTVLERYIGRELLPGDNESPAQLEEGRRYLKKIFNVYWRLPPPIASELKKFIEDDLFTPSKSDLDKIFVGRNAPTDLENLGSILARYFDGNFRQIIRFFEMVRFTFQIIEKKRAAVSAQEKPYFDELIAHPLLVIRTLMIQENCTPLFEAVLRNPEILLALEDAVENMNTNSIKEILDRYKLSENQRAFIEKFLFEQPRFFKDSSLVVTNLQPFLVLAADSSFGDGRGPSPEKFIEILNTGNPEAVKNSILSSGEPRLKEAADSFITAYGQRSVGPEQMAVITTLISALREIPTSHNSHPIFAQRIKDLDFQYVNTLSPTDRANSNLLVWAWIDSMEDKSQYADFAAKFSPVDLADWDYLKPKSAVGPFTTSRILNYFSNYYPSNRPQVLVNLQSGFDLLDKKTVISETAGLTPTIIEDMANNNQGIRDVAYDFMIFTDRQTEIHNRILERVKDLDQDFWNWIKQKISSTPIRTKVADLERAALSRMDMYPDDFGHVWGVMNFAGMNNFSNSSEIWQKLATVNINVLVANFAHFASSPIDQITPDKASARMLFSVMLEKISSGGEPQQVSLLRWFRKDVWLWKNMDKIRGQKTVEALVKSTNPDVAREATEVLNSWIPIT